MAITYQSGIPIDAIAPSTEDDDSPALKPIKALSEVLAGSLAPLVLILQRSILSCHRITANLQLGI
jgi:hypothetical protein